MYYKICKRFLKEELGNESSSGTSGNKSNVTLDTFYI